LPISTHVRDIQSVGGEIAGLTDPSDLKDLKGKYGWRLSQIIDDLFDHTRP